jgi:hypothetical protein
MVTNPNSTHDSLVWEMDGMETTLDDCSIKLKQTTQMFEHLLKEMKINQAKMEAKMRISEVEMKSQANFSTTKIDANEEKMDAKSH